MFCVCYIMWLLNKLASEAKISSSIINLNVDYCQRIVAMDWIRHIVSVFYTCEINLSIGVNIVEMYVKILHLNPGDYFTRSDGTWQSDSLALIHFHNAMIIWKVWKISTKATDMQKNILNNKSTTVINKASKSLHVHWNLMAGLNWYFV